jgi:hypothetical protein
LRACATLARNQNECTFARASAWREKFALRAFEQMIERDVIHAESCYEEDGEEVRRQEAREKIRPQGRREEGDAQRRGEEGFREEVLRQKSGCEEIRWQEGRREEVGRETRAGQAKESYVNNPPWIVGTAAGRLTGFARCDVLADQARSSAVLPRLISLFPLGVRSGRVFLSMGRWLAIRERERRLRCGKPVAVCSGMPGELARFHDLRPIVA